MITEYAVPAADADQFVTDNGYATNDGSDWSLGTPSKLNGVTGLHDAQSDPSGNIWFTNPEPSFERSLGMIETKTGKLTTFRIPGGEGGRAAATHGLAIDQKGILWFTVSPIASAEGAVGSLGSIDPKTPLPTRGLELRHISLDEHHGSTQVVLAYVRTGKVARVQFRTQHDLQSLKAQMQELMARVR